MSGLAAVDAAAVAYFAASFGFACVLGLLRARRRRGHGPGRAASAPTHRVPLRPATVPRQEPQPC